MNLCLILHAYINVVILLRIHGGGYMVGGIYMMGMTCAPMLAERFGAVVFLIISLFLAI